MRAFIPQGSKDSSNARESVWTEKETVLKKKSGLAMAYSRIMVGFKGSPGASTRCKCRIPILASSVFS